MPHDYDARGVSGDVVLSLLILLSALQLNKSSFVASVNLFHLLNHGLWFNKYV